MVETVGKSLAIVDFLEAGLGVFGVSGICVRSIARLELKIVTRLWALDLHWRSLLNV